MEQPITQTMSTNVAPAAVAPAAPAPRNRLRRIVLGIALVAALVAGSIFAVTHFSGGHDDAPAFGAGAKEK